MLKAGSVILLIMLIYAGLYAILLLALPDAWQGSEILDAILGEQIKDDDYRQAYMNVSRHKAAFALSTVIACFFIWGVGVRKGERWAWWGMVLVAGLAWGWGVVNTIWLGTTINMIMHLAGLVLLLVGLLLLQR